MNPQKPTNGRPFEKGNRAAANRKPTIAGLAVREIDDPEYAKAVRLADRYRKRRASEIATAHGWLSAGASGILATASLQLALSRYYSARAAEDPALAALASKLGNDARQNELAAWELAAREAAARPKEDPMLAAHRRIAAMAAAARAEDDHE